MIVAKFGGTPMACSENVKKVISMILGDARRRIIVVSAPGARFKGDRKVTDLLIDAAGKTGAAARMALVDDIADRYAEIAVGIGASLDLIEAAKSDLIKRLAAKDKNTSRKMDAIKAFGEEWSARILADAFKRSGHKARFVDPHGCGLVVTPQYGNATPDKCSYGKLAKLARYKGITVFPGFYGFTSDGHIATFSRGGSDLTGAIVAAAVKAKVYENFSDVPGIYAANPKIVTNPIPKIIPKLTFRELRELAYSGFAVFHDEAVQPILESKIEIPIHVRHFAYPKKEGTWIVRARKAGHGGAAGIASDFGFISINLEKHMMNREIGFGRTLLEIFEKRGLSYEHSPSSIDSISVVLKSKGLTKNMLDEILSEIRKTLNPDIIRVQDNLAMIAIVGEGMKESVGLAARATRAIADAKVNIEMISQGASEINIVFGVDEKSAAPAVNSLYKALIVKK
jgi:aspartate kinase